MLTQNEIWYRRAWGGFFLPVHWKGWALTVFTVAAACLAVFLLFILTHVPTVIAALAVFLIAVPQTVAVVTHTKR
jgi:hypothetical protein